MFENWPVLHRIGNAYAAAAYAQIDQIYGQKKSSIIKQNSSLVGNKIQVDGFLAQALLTGKEAYDLKTAITSSQRTRTSAAGEKYLAVPVEGKVRTMIESSDGWKHPGFSTEYYNQLRAYINNISIFTIMKFLVK